ncbi:quinolinate synthase NadA [Flammeovirga yaeyamensis]|uniref:Quinolinate synthase n=1 Tax=Flammeovirga yaeyamensis TaxID=367791 RepID=A0AAX1N8C4_9BACT|nr:quinolinate synthase NadA [Flammeovirga yaeyamensis]MBB3698058.1 quinolinate synthase [Flammeovirga yaeyamensis]NMF35590.1 quinolinate synthase NadA [Flammeovirga yaeyamensis]QWG03452.1 quinolinate synthase NadA [Flammeovirga yaeyamensis]
MLTQELKDRADQLGFIDVTENNPIDLKKEITRLKEEKNAVFLAHYYQDAEIQDLADFVGDSLALAQKAADTDADIILFAGVHFMAETAKIINPEKKVILPDFKAGCSLAEAAPAKEFSEFVKQYPDHTVVTYINSSADVKAYTDITVTSTNALKIINSLPEDEKIIFAPDRNLGKYIMKETGRDMLLWDGACIVHEAFALEKILDLHKENPHAKIIAHPESEMPLLKVASFVGSTAALLKFVQEDDSDAYIVATEAGILHKMREAVPHKNLIPAPSKEDNTCACSECHFMKMNTLEKVYNCLKYEYPEVEVNEDIRVKAIGSIERMFELS